MCQSYDSRVEGPGAENVSVCGVVGRAWSSPEEWQGQQVSTTGSQFSASTLFVS